MMLAASLLLALLAFGLAILLRSATSHSLKSHIRLPGPNALPFVGNIFNLPIRCVWKEFAKWSQQYGQLFRLQIFSTSVVVINSHAVAQDLLDRRGAIYSCKPRIIMLGELIGWDASLFLTPYRDPRYRKYRTAIKAYFSTARLHSYHDLQRKEVNRLLRDLRDTQGPLEPHMKRTAGAIILAILYGYEAKNTEDRMLKVLNDGVKTIGLSASISSLVLELLPPLRFLPDWLCGSWLKGVPTGTRQMLYDAWKIPFDHAVKQMASDRDHNFKCYVSDALKATDNDQTTVINTAASLYLGGYDTTSAAMLTTVLLLAKHPNVQARLHEELDTVIGRSRLPDFSDRSNLPYLDCVITESLRWSALISANPHRLIQDDVYNGMLIPKGTVVIANSWAMLHDPQVYPEPEKFLPERFFQASGSASPPDPKGVVFGFGRRRCPGEYFAENSLFLVIARMFHIYTVKQKTDYGGHLIPIDDDLGDTAIRRVKPFECTLETRWHGAGSLLQERHEEL